MVWFQGLAPVGAPWLLTVAPLGLVTVAPLGLVTVATFGLGSLHGDGRAVGEIRLGLAGDV